MNDLDIMRNDWALSKLAMDYARAADRHDGAGFAAVFTPDGIVEGIGGAGRVAGRDNLFKIPGMLKEMYQATVHTVLNHTATITGDEAEGETYSIAHHISWPQNNIVTRLTWAIRYQNNFVRTERGWLYSRRRLAIDWTETAVVKMIDWAEASGAVAEL